MSVDFETAGNLFEQKPSLASNNFGEACYFNA
jgi:hypothetical protein